jgi:chromosome segregation ATPase
VDAEGKRAFVGDINGLVHVFQCDNGALIATLQNNPPAIATRIAQIDQALTAHPESLTVAQKGAADAAAKLEEHKNIIAAATAAVQQSKDAVGPLLQQENEIKAKLEASRQALAAKKTEAETLRPTHAPALALVEQSRTALATAQGAGDGAVIATTQAALTDAEGKLNAITQGLTALDAAVAALTKEEQDLNNALAPATKAVADAQAKVAPAEADLKGKQDALAALEKAHADAQAHFQAKQTEPLRLKQARNHWTAATINAKALAENAVATTLNQEFEDQTSSFADAAKRINEAATELNAQRQALAELAQKLHDAQSATTPDQTIIKLLEVDIKAKQQSLSSASSALQKAEAEMIEMRQTIDQKTPERHTKLILSSQLKADYLRQLEQKIE